jgi:tetratricopeptide (TPR) repeat protein
MISKVVRVFVSVYLIISVIFYINVINHDYKVGKFLKEDNLVQFQEIVTGVPIYSTIAESIVKAYNENRFPRNCQYLNYLGDLLLDINPRSPYAFYMRATCKEISGDLKGAIFELDKAVLFEKQNPDYKFALAVLYFNLKEYKQSSSYLEQVKTIDPNYPKLDLLEDLLKNRESQIKVDF